MPNIIYVRTHQVGIYYLPNMQVGRNDDSFSKIYILKKLKLSNLAIFFLYIKVTLLYLDVKDLIRSPMKKDVSN